MSISPDTVVLAAVCRPDGTLVEIIYDELGVKPSRSFLSIVHASSQRKAKRFLKAAVSSHSALDWELHLALAHGIATFFFSACMTRKGLLIIGMKDTVHPGTLPHELSAAPGHEAAASSLVKLNAQKQTKAHVQKRLRKEVERLAATVASQGTIPKGSQGEQMPLLRMLAHDLRNPISGILAASQYLIEDAATLLDDQQGTLLRSIESSSRQMLRLIEDLLEVSTAGTKGSKLQLQQSDLAILMEQGLAMHRALARSKNMQIETEVHGAPPLLEVDPAKMAQAISALLVSAIRSSRAGSVLRIAINTRPGQVVISIRALAEDTGNNRTVASRPSKKKGPESSALALFVARSIVARHGGTVRAQQIAQQPSFTVSLPRSRR